MDVEIRSPSHHRLAKHNKAVRTLVFNQDGTRLASGGEDGTLILWDIENYGLVGSHVSHGAQVDCVASSWDGTRLASGGYDRTVKVWDLRSEKMQIAELRGHSAIVAGIAFSKDGSTLFSAGRDRTVKVWDLATNRAFRVSRA